jgi:hypothetical protein
MNSPHSIFTPAIFLPLAIFAVLHLLLLLGVVDVMLRSAGKSALCPRLWRWLCLAFPYALLAGGLLLVPASVSFILAALAMIAAPFTPAFKAKATSTPDESHVSTSQAE